MHVALDSRDGQTEHMRVGAGERGYLIRHTSATEDGPYRVGHTVQDAFVFQPAAADELREVMMTPIP